MNSSSSEALSPQPAQAEKHEQGNSRFKSIRDKVRSKITNGQRPAVALQETAVEDPEAEAAKFIKEKPIPFREYPSTPEDKIKGEIARIQHSQGKDKEIRTDLPPEIQEAVKNAFDAGTSKSAREEEAKNKVDIASESKRIEELMLQAQRKTNYLERKKIASIGEKLGMGHKPLTYENTLTNEEIDREMKSKTNNVISKQAPDNTRTNTTEQIDVPDSLMESEAWEKYFAQQNAAREFYNNPPNDREGDEDMFAYNRRKEFKANPPKNLIIGESDLDYILRGGPEELEEMNARGNNETDKTTSTSKDTADDTSKKRRWPTGGIKKTIFDRLKKPPTEISAENSPSTSDTKTQPIIKDDTLEEVSEDETTQDDKSTKTKKAAELKEKVFGRFKRSKTNDEPELFPDNNRNSNDRLASLTFEELSDERDRLSIIQDRAYSSDFQATIHKIDRLQAEKRSIVAKSLLDRLNAGEALNDEMRAEIIKKIEPDLRHADRDRVVEELEWYTDPDIWAQKPDILIEGTTKEIKAEIQKTKDPNRKLELEETLAQRNKFAARKLLDQFVIGGEVWAKSEMLHEVTGEHFPLRITDEEFIKKLKEVAGLDSNRSNIFRRI